MRLTNLEPEWINYNPATKGHRRYSDTHSHVIYDPADDAPFSAEPFTEAQGITFLCPTCFVKNGGAVGTEHVLLWFKGVPPEADQPGNGRWDASGTSFNDLTLSPSVNVDHEHWHGWIKNGEVS